MRWVQGLLEVMASAEQVHAPSAEVSTLLAVCIRDSLESAFQWHIEQTAKDADNDALRICLLAKASVNLLGIEVATFSPVLAPYLPIAADVAAKALHELFGSQLLPWLATGISNWSVCPSVCDCKSTCPTHNITTDGWPWLCWSPDYDMQYFHETHLELSRQAKPWQQSCLPYLPLFSGQREHTSDAHLLLCS